MPPFLPPPPSLSGLVFFSVYISLIIMSNVATFVAFLVEKQLQTYNNYYIINLVLADLLVGFVLIAQIVNVYHPETWLCKIHLGLNDALLTVSIIGIVVICIDRHRAAFDPIGHFTSRRKSKAVLANAATWVISLAFWLPYTIVWDIVATQADPDNPFNDACVPRYGIRLWTSVLPIALTIGLPLVLIAVLYSRVYWKIRYSLGPRHVRQQFGKDNTAETAEKQSPSQLEGVVDAKETRESSEKTKSTSVDKSKQDSSTKATSASEKEVKQEKAQDRESRSTTRKATRTLTFIIISFLVAWIPHIVFLLVTTLDRSLLFGGKIPPPALVFISLMRYTNSFLNPVSYAAAQPLFRTTIVKLFCCPWRYIK
ncbi:5-hydroxytryptamine receptor 1A-alpha-like [Diadema antillarum]|uniref:5-hydroxytryptamine receptor 1A-alpha-like n=2 Tax=Diadema antillarum TaxID=105358 RepID=UPI003A86C80C